MAQPRNWRQLAKPTLTSNEVYSIALTPSINWVLSYDKSLGKAGLQAFNLQNQDAQLPLPSGIEKLGANARMIYDAQGRILMITGRQGNGIFVYQGGEWQELKAGDSQDSIRAFHGICSNPRNGEIWSITKVDGNNPSAYSEVYCYRNGRVTQVDRTDFGKPDITGMDITISPDGNRAYAVYNNSATGIHVYDAQFRFRVNEFTIPYSSTISSVLYTSDTIPARLYTLNDGSLLHLYSQPHISKADTAISKGGALIWNPGTGEWKNLLTNAEIRAAIQDSARNLWVNNGSNIQAYSAMNGTLLETINLQSEAKLSKAPQITNIAFRGKFMWVSTADQGILYDAPEVSSSINDQAEQTKSLCWPNPVMENGVLHIRMQADPGTIHLISLDGKLLSVSYSQYAEYCALDLQGIPPGVYAVKMANTVIKERVIIY